MIEQDMAVLAGLMPSGLLVSVQVIHNGDEAEAANHYYELKGNRDEVNRGLEALTQRHYQEVVAGDKVVGEATYTLELLEPYSNVSVDEYVYAVVRHLPPRPEYRRLVGMLHIEGL